MKRFNPLKPNTPQPLTGARIAAPPVPGTFGVTLNPNPEGTGLELRFPKRPSDEILNAIKAAGWRWSRFRMCWYHRNTPENTAFGQRFITAASAAAATAPVAQTSESAVSQASEPASTPIIAPPPEITTSSAPEAPNPGSAGILPASNVIPVQFTPAPAPVPVHPVPAWRARFHRQFQPQS